MAIAGFCALGALSFVCFLFGLVPGYQLEQNGTVPEVSTRCPEAIPSEAGSDVACVDALIARGPLALGVPALATSFVLGLGAIASLVRRRGPFRITGIGILVLYLGVWIALISWNAAEGDRLGGPASKVSVSTAARV